MTTQQSFLLFRVIKKLWANLLYLLRFRLESIDTSIENINQYIVTNRNFIKDVDTKIEKQNDEIIRLLSGIDEYINKLNESNMLIQEDIQHLEEKKKEAAKERALLEQRLSDSENILQKIEKRIAQIDRETLCLLQTCFGADSWLEHAKDKHKGERCFLLGCGPSLRDMDLGRLNNEYVMGVNGTYLLDSLHIHYYCTVSNFFWKDHIGGLSTFECDRMFLPPYIKIQPESPTTWLRVIEDTAYARVGVMPWFFSKEAHRYVCLGGTVIAVCMQILYHLGFQEIITLGLDHDYGLTEQEQSLPGLVKSGSSVNAHFIPNYYKPETQVYINIPATERAYRLALESFEGDGRRILNATPGTKLELFPRVEFDSLFG